MMHKWIEVVLNKKLHKEPWRLLGDDNYLFTVKSLIEVEHEFMSNYVELGDEGWLGFPNLWSGQKP